MVTYRRKRASGRAAGLGPGDAGELETRLPVRVGADDMSKTNAAHATATGKAILAWLPELHIGRVIAANGLTRFTQRTIVTIPGPWKAAAAAGA